MGPLRGHLQILMAKAGGAGIVGRFLLSQDGSSCLSLSCIEIVLAVYVRVFKEYLVGTSGR